MTTEKRLIDANEVWHKIHKRREAAYRELDHPRCNAYLNAEFDVMDAPTVDAVEVVRCKGCKKRDTNLCPLYHCVSPMITSMDDDFCSHGERKTDV